MGSLHPPGAAGDRELWLRASDGDAAAFGELFSRHASAVYNHLFRRVADWSEAEDLTSAVFLQAWRRRGRVVIDRESALQTATCRTCHATAASCSRSSPPARACGARRGGRSRPLRPPRSSPSRHGCGPGARAWPPGGPWRPCGRPHHPPAQGAPTACREPAGTECQRTDTFTVQAPPGGLALLDDVGSVTITGSNRDTIAATESLAGEVHASSGVGSRPAPATP
jgi:hypothetical protein